jgi:hypothetical protein
MSEAEIQAVKKILWNSEFWETTQGELYPCKGDAFDRQVEIEKDRLRAI